MIKLSVPTMGCQGCSVRINKHLSQITEIKDLAVDLESKIITLETDLPLLRIQSELESIGYPTEIVKE